MDNADARSIAIPLHDCSDDATRETLDRIKAVVPPAILRDWPADALTEAAIVWAALAELEQLPFRGAAIAAAADPRRAAAAQEQAPLIPLDRGRGIASEPRAARQRP